MGNELARQRLNAVEGMRAGRALSRLQTQHTLALAEQNAEAAQVANRMVNTGELYKVAVDLAVDVSDYISLRTQGRPELEMKLRSVTENSTIVEVNNMVAGYANPRPW